MMLETISEGSSETSFEDSADETAYQSRWLRSSIALLVLSYFGLAACVGVGVAALVDKSNERRVAAWTVAALFAGVSIPVSLRAIRLHARHYRSHRCSGTASAC